MTDRGCLKNGPMEQSPGYISQCLQLLGKLPIFQGPASKQEMEIEHPTDEGQAGV